MWKRKEVWKLGTSKQLRHQRMHKMTPNLAQSCLMILELKLISLGTYGLNWVGTTCTPALTCFTDIIQM